MECHRAQYWESGSHKILHIFPSNPIQSHGLNYVEYAADTQVYALFDVSDPEVALNRLNSCFSDIRTWMLQNKLKINDGKTKFLLIGTSNTHTKIKSSDHQLTVGSATITPWDSARNLGVIFDKHMALAV